VGGAIRVDGVVVSRRFCSKLQYRFFHTKAYAKNVRVFAASHSSDVEQTHEPTNLNLQPTVTYDHVHLGVFCAGPLDLWKNILLIF
jgi:hypothetical protein